MKELKELNIVDDDIRLAYAHPSPTLAARTIDEIASRVKKTATLAEARLRILVKRLELPPESPAPPTLEGDLAGLFDYVGGWRSATIESAKHLMCAALAEGFTDIEIEEGPSDTIQFTWRPGDELGWIWSIYPPRIPWPGVAVRVYWPKEGMFSALHAETFFTAHRVLGHARKRRDSYEGYISGH